MSVITRKHGGAHHPSKADMKKLVDMLEDLRILAGNYTGKLTLHLTEGTVAGIQYDHMIRPI